MVLPYKRKRNDFLRGICVKMPGVNVEVEEMDHEGMNRAGKS